MLSCLHPPATLQRTVCALVQRQRHQVNSNDCHTTGHRGNLKRSRSDVTLVSLVDTGDNTVPDADASDESQVVRRKRRRTVVEEIPSRSIPQDHYAEEIFSEHSYIYPPSPSHDATNSHLQEIESISASLLSTPPQSNTHDANLLVSRPFHSCHSPSDACMMPIACEGLPEQTRRRQSSDPQDVTVSDSDGDEERECESLVTPKGIPACTPIPALAGGLTLSPSEAGGTLDARRSASQIESSASSEFDSFPVESNVSDAADLSSDSSRLAAPDGDITRIEITFDKLYQELLSSRDHDTLIQEVAGRIAASSRWSSAFEEYQKVLRKCRFSWGCGNRKNRFMDIMNLILEEAPKHGLNVPYAHDLLYGRYNYDGSEWKADVSEKFQPPKTYGFPGITYRIPPPRPSVGPMEPFRGELLACFCAGQMLNSGNQMTPCLLVSGRLRDANAAGEVPGNALP